MDDLRWAGAAEQADLLRSGQLSASELHALTVARIERLDPAIRAVVCPLFDRPASGVPMLLKDAGAEIEGTPHWVGVAALRDAGARSPHTTELARRFESVGFSVVGKGACPALSEGATTEPAGFEPTTNPWDPTRSAGGSSGGPAAAVAAGLVAVAHGSDATGSLRCPAALCGVATLNPSSGRIPSVPPVGGAAQAIWRDFVLVRHAADLAFAFTALTGAVVPREIPVLRVGVLDHDPELGLPVHPVCSEAARRAGRTLEALGHRVEVSWPRALDHLWARAFGPFSVVGDSVRPPRREWVSARLGRPVRRGELPDAFFDACERAESRSADEVAEAAATFEATTLPILDWWGDHDILVTPTTFQPAWPLGTPAGPAEMGTLLAPFSFTGQPALSLPLGRTADGLPVGVQLVGRPGGDEMLLALAQQLQNADDWTGRRPPLD